MPSNTTSTNHSYSLTANILLSWVSDLVWLDETPYDPATGSGALGVEFAGTAVSSPSPFGQNITIAKANNISDNLISANRELQWSEAYYRGYYELHVSREKVDARYFGLPTIINQNPNEISLANFTVRNGGNRLERFNGSAAVGGLVTNGALKGGQLVQTNVTNATDTGKYFISHEDVENL
jgi:alkaline phosphatase D